MDYRKRSRVGLFCISWLFREFLFFLVPLSSHSRSCCQITSTASKQLPNEPLLCVQLPPSLHLLQPTTLYLYEPDSCPSDSKNAKSPLASSFLTFISRGIFGLRVWDVQHLWFTSYPPLLPPLSPSPRGSISARGAHVMGMLPGEVRPGIQSFPDFTLCLHPDIPAWHWSHRWPGRRFPGQTRGLQAQAGSQCVATCQARCQAGQDLHSKAAGWPANLDPEIIELPLIEHCQCGMQIRSPGFPLRQGNNFRIVFDTN